MCRTAPRTPALRVCCGRAVTAPAPQAKAVAQVAPACPQQLADEGVLGRRSVPPLHEDLVEVGHSWPVFGRRRPTLDGRWHKSCRRGSELIGCVPRRRRGLNRKRGGGCSPSRARPSSLPAHAPPPAASLGSVWGPARRGVGADQWPLTSPDSWPESGLPQWHGATFGLILSQTGGSCTTQLWLKASPT